LAERVRNNAFLEFPTNFPLRRAPDVASHESYGAGTIAARRIDRDAPRSGEPTRARCGLKSTLKPMFAILEFCGNFSPASPRAPSTLSRQ
jgi:hypothetical protein